MSKRILQLKWSDEPWWKDTDRELEPAEIPEDVIRQEQAQWASAKPQWRSDRELDCSFRVIEVVAQ